MFHKVRPPAETACLPVTHSPAGWAPWLHCCFKLKRKHHPLTFLFFYKCNKYLSTKIAHLSHHKQGPGAALVSRCMSPSLVFTQHMGRPLIKKVCAKKRSSHQPNSSTRGADGSLQLCVSALSAALAPHAYQSSEMNSSEIPLKIKKSIPDQLFLHSISDKRMQFIKLGTIVQICMNSSV